jgi:hypothetical protein
MQVVKRLALDGFTVVITHPFVPYILILAVLLKSL